MRDLNVCVGAVMLKQSSDQIQELWHMDLKRQTWVNICLSPEISFVNLGFFYIFEMYFGLGFFVIKLGIHFEHACNAKGLISTV